MVHHLVVVAGLDQQMTEQDRTEVGSEDTVRGELVLPRDVTDRQLAEALVARAESEGLDLVGPDGLLGQFTKQVLESALSAELTHHLGYDAHARTSGVNARNGTTSKTVQTDVGPVRIDITWTFANYLAVFDPVYVRLFWRSVWAASFLFGFMLLRDGVRGTVSLFRAMGLPGIAIGFCFAGASTTFVLALGHTTVANILLIYAGAPLFAALFARLLFGEHISGSTWAAIAAVIMLNVWLIGRLAFEWQVIVAWGELLFQQHVGINPRLSATPVTPTTRGCAGRIRM
jgi:hypothetical protein